MWKRIQEELTIWRVAALPGFVIITLIIIARLTGSLQWLEWITLDTFLRLRPSEPIDERIVIVGINEEDIASLGSYPITDRDLAELIKKLQQYKPSAIGLDIVRDKPQKPGHTELVEVFKQSKNIIGIEKVLPPDKFKSAATLSPDRVGFSDAIPDGDGKYRRNLLWTPNPQNLKEDKYSLSLRLAENYLSNKGYTLGYGKDKPPPMQFGSTELPLFLSNSGGYVGADAHGIQTLINWRSGKKPFRILSLKDIKTGNFQPDWIRDRIILIGITTSTVPDFINTSAVTGLKLHGQIYGIEYQAHACSQIISAVLDGRPLLKTWADEWEYLWIFIWGFFGIIIVRLTQSALKTLLAIGLTSIFIIAIGYIFLLGGWWIPIAPVLLILPIHLVNAFACYEYTQTLKSKNHEIIAKQNIITAKQNAIELAFTEIHNGPLQTIAILMRNVQTQDCSKEQLLTSLKTVRSEIHELGEYLKDATLSEEESLRLSSDLTIDLKLPIHELLYEVYNSTLERQLPYFQNIKKPVCDFVPIEEQNLSIDLKRGLCRFLE
jgi:CHASE2 domain-containing sensor protein